VGGRIRSVSLALSDHVPKFIPSSVGDITYANLLGSDVLIINSRAALSAIFKSRSANNPDRPSLYFACELVGWKDLPVLMPIGREHTGHRRLMAKTIGTKALIGNMLWCAHDAEARDASSTNYKHNEP
jgi:hypothetical protein